MKIIAAIANSLILILICIIAQQHQSYMHDKEMLKIPEILRPGIMDADFISNIIYSLFGMFLVLFFGILMPYKKAR